MTFTPAQTFGKYTNLSANLLASIAMVMVVLYFYYRSKKSPLLFAYLSILGLLTLWTVSKIFKTVTPNVTLRWFFVVIQYFGVQFLGFAILLFAILYAGYPIPGKKWISLLLIHPFVSFLIVLTNPLHMSFYSVFTYNRTRFGFFFLPSQIILYAYIIIGMILLVRRSFEPSFHRKKRIISRIFASLAIAPLFINFYYITFKLTDIPWIFPFRPFDITPIAMALSITLFAIPAIKYNFLDISRLSYHHLYQHMNQGIILFNHHLQVLDMNQLAKETFPWLQTNEHLSILSNKLFGRNQPHIEEALNTFMAQKGKNQPPLLTSHNQLFYKWRIEALDDKTFALLVIDISEIVNLQHELENLQENLDKIHQELLLLTEKEKALAMFRARAVISQNVHDIVGHSLTVVMGTLELALLEKTLEGIDETLAQGKELLLNSLSDLHHSLSNSACPDIPNLLEAIMSLEGTALALDLNCHGKPFPLDSMKNHAIYRLCREAVTNTMKHSQATTIHIFLRYQPDQVEIYAIDNGGGCSSIQESLGLAGIRERITLLGGDVSFGTVPGSGFHIHAKLPIGAPSK